MSDITNLSTEELAEILRKKKADEAYARKQAERERKIAAGEMRAVRGREKGSVSLRQQILNSASAMASLVSLNAENPENALIALVYRDVFRGK